MIFIPLTLYIFRTFCMIPYNQTTSKITNTESFRLKSCIRRTADSIDKRFCFDIIPEDRWVLEIYETNFYEII